MIVKQKITHQDGTESHSEYNIPFKKGPSQISWTLFASNGDPIVVRILHSGWSESNGSRMYHVLTEYGDYEETSYSHLNESQLLDRHPEFSTILESTFKDLIVSSQEVLDHPNDLELGKMIRKRSISK